LSSFAPGIRAGMRVSQGDMLGRVGMTGSATGSFVRGPNNFSGGQPIRGSTPQGVIGNWNVGSGRYNATGIFAGSIKDN